MTARAELRSSVVLVALAAVLLVAAAWHGARRVQLDLDRGCSHGIASACAHAGRR